MRLYSGSVTQFIEETTQNQITHKLRGAFFDYFRYYPGEAEVRSWQNSLRALSLTFNYARLTDHGILLEYQLPMTSKRLDCLVCGQDAESKDQAIIIELKQWVAAADTPNSDKVMTLTGGRIREVLHPAVQVGQYAQYLTDMHSAFQDENPVNLAACSYLHNYSPLQDDALYAEKFVPVMRDYPVFCANDTTQLKDFLQQKLSNGNGPQVLKRVEESRYQPSKKLMEHVSDVISTNTEYVLLDEQLVVFDKVLSLVKQGLENKKTVLVVKGGPGTGKSVIALHLMAELMKHEKNTFYATGSKAFTETLRTIVGSRAGKQFRYFNSFAEAAKDEIDVLICDEAHRIREVSWNQFTPKAKRKEKKQIEELIDASKVCVFFVDDMQVVRPKELGTSSYIKEWAEQKGAEVLEYELEAQFRCSGSDAFVNWVSNTFEIQRTANVIWDQSEDFDFKIMDSPEELDQAIQGKIAEGNKARLVAGFCWPWSNPTAEGQLVNDVVIGEYKKPWNAKPDKIRLAAEIPPASLWAYDPRGFGQVGCIYTAQGFEFDYVGVIVGRDLVYRFGEGWAGDPTQSSDGMVKRSKEHFLEFVKNSYRVLFTRGMKGCYVYFVDKETEKLFRSRVEAQKSRENQQETQV